MRALLYCLKLVSALKAHGHTLRGLDVHKGASGVTIQPMTAFWTARLGTHALGETAALCGGRLWRGDGLWLPFAPLPLGPWKKKPAAMLQGAPETQVGRARPPINNQHQLVHRVRQPPWVPSPQMTTPEPVAWLQLHEASRDPK